MYYCYILYSAKLDKYYIGSTSDIEGRLSRHNSSGKGFTSTGKPWVLKYFEKYPEKSQAIKREYELKRWKDRIFLEALITKGSGHPG
ncbi:MAG: GIY-YIG nuclease family protein [Prolixibacteraceae bacterium]|nr:GIY-YIG nuclease family protein [Prolixibacteraceae bacterium]